MIGFRHVRLDRAAPALLVIALAALLPFVQFWRLPPLASFWGEFAAVVVFALWLTLQRWKRASDASWRENLPLSALPFAVLAAVTVAQVIVGRGIYPSMAAVVALMLLLCIGLCVEAAGLDSDSRERHLDAFGWGSIAALVANGASIALTHAGLESLPFAMSTFGLREVGLVGQSNHLGDLAVFAWCATMRLWRRGRLGSLAAACLAGMAGFLAAGSSSRTALVLFALAVVLFAVARDRSGHGRSTVAGVPAVALGAAVFVLGYLAWQSLQSLDAAASVSVVRSSVSGRGEMLRDAWLLGWQAPWLGNGLGSYSGLRLFELTGSLQYPHSNHAHNLFGQLWAEWGGLPVAAVAVAAATALLASGRRIVSRQWDSSDAYVGTWVFGLLIHSQVEHPLWFAYLLMPFAWFCGMVVQPALRLPAARPAGRWSVALVAGVALAGCFAAALDYRRTERLATDIYTQVKLNSDHGARIPIAEAQRIAHFTLFAPWADRMYVRTLAIDTVLPDMKRDAARRTLEGLAASEFIARYVIFSAIAGDEAEVRTMVDSLRRRNSALAETVEQRVGLMAEGHPEVWPFLRAAGLPTQSDPEKAALLGNADG